MFYSLSFTSSALHPMRPTRLVRRLFRVPVPFRQVLALLRLLARGSLSTSRPPLRQDGQDHEMSDRRRPIARARGPVRCGPTPPDSRAGAEKHGARSAAGLAGSYRPFLRPVPLLSIASQSPDRMGSSTAGNLEQPAGWGLSQRPSAADRTGASGCPFSHPTLVFLLSLGRGT